MRSSDRRFAERVLDRLRDIPSAERSSTPPWVRQQDEIEAAAYLVDDAEAVPLFDRFELLATLGEGGYGCVFMARDPRLDRIVAIKRCTSRSEHAAKILLSEARTLAQLSDPNIITIHESGEDEGDVFFVMEYVSGGSLEEFACRQRDAPRSWRELVPIFMRVAQGLAAAHREGVVHGDLKPANVLLHEDLRPRVADFGLARTVGGPTLMPEAVGTRAYAAPEVLAGQVRDTRSDQWSFFVTLWHCLAGELPFKNPDPDAEDPDKFWSSEESVLQAIDAWPGSGSLRANVPEQLRELMRVGLSLDPDERFADMEVVGRELDKIATLALVDAPALEPTTREPTRPGWRRKGLGLGVTLAVAAMGLLGEVYLMSPRTTATNVELPTPKPLDKCEAAKLAFDEAFAAIEDKNLQASYDIWKPAHDVLQGCDPKADAERSLELADKMNDYKSGQELPAWVAARAAKSFENLEDWAGAAMARERAASLYEAADAPVGRNEQLDCLGYNRSNTKCPRSAP